MTAPPPPARVRQQSERVLRNDERLLDAALAVLAQDGWAGMSFLRVAQHAGLSRRTLQLRFSSPSDLMAAVWVRRAWPLLRDLLERSMAAGGLCGGPPDAGRLTELMASADRPTPELRAAIELLIIAHFDPELRGAVRATFGEAAATWLGVDPVTAARRGVLISAMLGLVLVSSARAGELDLSGQSSRLVTAFSIPVPPGELPSGEFAHLDEPVPFDTGDQTTDRLLQATLDLIGSLGFESATTEAIAERAGVSQGALFARYSTKLDLVTEAVTRQNEVALRLNHDAMARITAAHNEGVADAVFMRESQVPDRAHLRAITLESMRVVWHSPRVGEGFSAVVEEFAEEYAQTGASSDRAYMHVGLAIGSGMLLIPLVFAECWLMPHDVVLVPFAAS